MRSCRTRLLIPVNPAATGTPTIDSTRVDVNTLPFAGIKLDAFNGPRQNKRHPMNSTTIPTQVCFDGMDASDALHGKIEQRVQRLSRFAGDIEACRVTLRACEHHHRRGNRYNVHARVMMHGRVIEAGHTPVPDLSHDDPYAAVAQTFDSLRRRIEDHVRRRGDVKTRMKD